MKFLYQFNIEQTFIIFFTVIECLMWLWHLFVHLGIKNSNLLFLMKQYHFFILDGIITIIHVIYFWNSYFYLKPVLIYILLAHIYYVLSMFTFNKPCNIFFWSCFDCIDNRFSIRFIKENLETAGDITCHFLGFLMFFNQLNFKNKIISIILSIIVLCISVVNKNFNTKYHMMPDFIKIFRNYNK